MKLTQTFVSEHGKISFSDLDEDNEMEIEMIDYNKDTTTMWLNKQNLLSLKEHLEYLLLKLE